MAWWHCDMVTSKAKVAKDCKKMANIGKNWFKGQKGPKSSQMFVRAAKSCQKDTENLPREA